MLGCPHQSAPGRDAHKPTVHERAGTEGSGAGKPSRGSRGAEDVVKPDRRRTAPQTSGAVGPPPAAGSRLAEREVYYDDNEADEEADSELLEEEDDDVDFSRTGMHAEL